MQSEISQSQKYRHCMTPPIRGSYKIVQFKELPSGTVVARGWGRGDAELLINMQKQDDVACIRACVGDTAPGQQHAVLVLCTQYCTVRLNLQTVPVSREGLLSG